MTRLRSQISISLDGYVAGPNQSQEHPLGEGCEPRLEPVEVVASPTVTHVKYRVAR